MYDNFVNYFNNGGQVENLNSDLTPEKDAFG